MLHAVNSSIHSVGRDQFNFNTFIANASTTEILERFAVLTAAYNSFERQSEHASTCAEGTRVTVLDKIVQWAQGNHHVRMCLLNGHAGTGKSTIACDIAQKCDQAHRLCFSFFFSRRNRDRSDLTKFIPTLAYQLAIFLPGVQDSMRSAITRNPAVFHQNLNVQFTQLILDPLLSIVDALPTMIMVIDGLDECSRDAPLAELITLFRDLTDQLPFRLFFTSRPEARILEIFNSPSLNRQIYRLALQDFNSRVEVHDLLRSRLLTVREKRGLPSTWPSTDDLNQLSKQSDGLYIYSETLIRFIDDEYGSPEKRLRSALDAYSGIDYLYDQVLLEARRYEGFQRVIGSILFLAKPLNISALVELLQLTSDGIRLALRGCSSILIIPDSDGDYIRPYHASLQDFFANRDRATDHFLNPLEYNLSIMDDCVKLLRDGLNDKGRESLGYACRYWCHHLRLVISCTNGVDHIRSTLETGMTELMTNLQSRWLINWMTASRSSEEVNKMRKDLRFVVAHLEEKSAILPKLQETLKAVDKFLDLLNKKRLEREWSLERLRLLLRPSEFRSESARELLLLEREPRSEREFLESERERRLREDEELEEERRLELERFWEDECKQVGSEM